MYKVKQIDGEWSVVDDLGNVMSTHDTRILARDAKRELDKPVSNVHRIDGTYGDGKADVNETVDFVPERPALVIPPAIIRTIDYRPVVKPVAPKVRRVLEKVRPLIEAPPVAQVVAVVKPNGKVRNSDLCRARIALAKRDGESKEVCYTYGVEVLGQKRQLARAYVNDNWDKVVPAAANA